MRDDGFLEELRHELSEHAMAAETRRSYTSHQKAWRAWCDANDIKAAWATPRQVAQHLTWYLVQLDAVGDAVRDPNGFPIASVAPATLRLRLSAIDKAFETAGQARPGQDLEVKTLMEGVRRLYGVAPVYAKQPVLLDDLRRMAAVLQQTQAPRLHQLAMVQVHRQTGATPGQIATLCWDDVDLSGRDAYLLLPPDRRSGPRRRARLRASSTPERCPVRALTRLSLDPPVKLVV